MQRDARRWGTIELALGIDFGTSYFKLGLFDRAGALRGLGRVAVESDVDGVRCELPVERFWTAVHEGLAEALKAADAKASDIQAVAYSSQANTFTLLDERDEPLMPMIVWTDLRAEPVEPAIAALWARKDFLDVTGVGVGGGGFCLAKLAWIQKHHPDLWSRARRVQTISDYFVYSLTGEAAGDEGTASLMGDWDLRNHALWAPALKAAGVSRRQMSQPLPPGTVAGRVTDKGAERLGLRPGIPVAVGSLDHQIAAIGAGISETTLFSESTGTVLACLGYSNDYSPKANCIMGPGSHGYAYYQLAWCDNGGGPLEWYQKTRAPSRSIPELVDLAASVPIGSDGLMARPCANSYDGLDGFLGAAGRHGDGHFVRAILESTAASLAELIDALSPSAPAARIIATGGGARSEVWLKIKADLLNAEFVTTDCEEPACRGAGMLAAVAAGWFDNIQQAGDAWVSLVQTIRPQPANHAAYADWRRRYDEVLPKR